MRIFFVLLLVSECIRQATLRGRDLEEIVENDPAAEPTSQGVSAQQSSFPNFATNILRILFGNLPSNLIAQQSESSARAKSLLPIYYLHFPKCGSSFAATLGNFAMGIQKPGPDLWKSLAPDHGGVVYTAAKLALDWTPRTGLDGIDRTQDCSDQVAEGDGETREFNAACSNRFSPGAPCFLRYRSNHYPLTKSSACADAYAPHISAMFRDPVERMLSGWDHMENHHHHDCLTKETENITMVQYAKCVGSCMTNMLTGNDCGSWGKEHDAKAEEVKRSRAVAMVRRLGFVGITSEWPLSVCLFHAMFGGECLRQSFENTRPGRNRTAVSALPDVRPALDSDLAVYKEALRVFRARVDRYGVTNERCMREICPQAQEKFQRQPLLVATQQNLIYDED